MNREQRRAIEKKARASGMKSNEAKAFARIADNKGAYSPPQEINEGEKVAINIEMVKARKDYDGMQASYKEFVESSEGKFFTAHKEKENLISLTENPRWWFWSGDLVKVEQEKEE